MKKLLYATLIVLLVNQIFPQEIKYQTKIDIPYYSESLSKNNEYIKERCLLDIYYPTNVNNFATVVWFHGGGLNSGNKSFPEELFGKGICIVSVNYRLYPRAKSPEYIKDAAASVAWVFKNIAKYGGDTTLIFVAGHSAGGYLASMVGLDKRWLNKFNIDANKIAGIIPCSGQAITHFTIREERGIPEKQPIVDEFAPLYHVRADAPPLLLITGDRELEMLGRYEENAYMMRMMKIAGHKKTKLFELDGYGHSMLLPAYPLLLNEIQKIKDSKKTEKKTAGADK